MKTSIKRKLSDHSKYKHTIKSYFCDFLVFLFWQHQLTNCCFVACPQKMFFHKIGKALRYSILVYNTIRRIWFHWSHKINQASNMPFWPLVIGQAHFRILSPQYARRGRIIVWPKYFPNIWVRHIKTVCPFIRKRKSFNVKLDLL